MACLGPQLRSAAAIGFALLAGVGGCAAQNRAEVYSGKTISLTVGYAPGGIYDISARLTGRYLTRYIPGHPGVVVRNVPGAGGLTQANQLFNTAPRDGTEIGIIGRAAPQLAVLGEPGPRFNPVQFNWLGTSSSYQDDAYLLFIRSDFGIAGLDEARASKRKINFGAGGPGSSNLAFGNIAADVLGLPLAIVKGYPGAAPIVLAMQTGELESTVMGVSSIRAGQRDLLDSKRITGLVQFGRMTRHPDFPDVPTAREAAANKEDRWLIELAEAPFFMALPYAAPPEVPADRIAILRKAFMELHADPDFLVEAKKLDLDISPLDGQSVQKLIERMAETPREVIERLKINLSK
jgi:tripartite-type tricarboxylate transporter receptor subunit TctC